MASSSTVWANSAAGLTGFCRPKRRLRRRRGATLRLGNRRRVFSLGTRHVVQWGFVVIPIRALRKMIIDMVPNAQFIEGVYWSLPFLRPQVFPLC